MLLDSAAGLLRAGGPAAVSVRAVAEASGTSFRAVYAVFGSKRALIDALAERGYRSLVARTSAIDATGDPRRDLVRAGAVAFREFALEEPEMFRLTFEQVSAEVLGHDRVAEAALDAYRALRVSVRPCARRRRGPPRPVRGELLLRLPQCVPGPRGVRARGTGTSARTRLLADGRRRRPGGPLARRAGQSRRRVRRTTRGEVGDGRGLTYSAGATLDATGPPGDPADQVAFVGATSTNGKRLTHGQLRGSLEDLAILRGTQTEASRNPCGLRTLHQEGYREHALVRSFVELAGIEPASCGAVPGLLRVQFVMSLFSAPALPRTGCRRAQSG